MKTLVNNLLNLIEESNGYYMTDLKEIETDSDMSMMWQEDSSIGLMYENESIKIDYSDIAGICYDVIQDTVIAILKLINRPNILIHML